ncbi:MAG: PAS domain-containing protein, partial [Terrabacter sp.]
MSEIPDADGAAGDDLFRWMVAASPDGLWVFDDAGRTLYANARMAEMLGRDADDMVGFSVFDAVDEVGKVQFRRHLDELATRGEPGDNLECSLLDSRGERFWALVSHTPLVDRSGRRRGWMHRVSEHSVQRKLLDQLAEAQTIAKIGSWEWDVGSDRVSWSDELYRIYGMDRSELAPTYEGFLARIHPDDRAHVAETVATAVASEDSFEFDARVLRSSGESGWIRGRGLVTRDLDGNAVRMGGTAHDITEQKDAEQALCLVTALATAANESATLDEALPTFLVEVARHTTWRPVLATVLDADGDLGAPIVAADSTETSTLPVEVGMDFAARAAADRTVVADASPAGSVIVAVPVIAEERVACVVVLDMRSSAPPVASDAATIAQLTALFARVADREWTAQRLAHARDAAMAA